MIVRKDGLLYHCRAERFGVRRELRWRCGQCLYGLIRWNRERRRYMCPRCHATVVSAYGPTERSYPELVAKEIARCTKLS